MDFTDIDIDPRPIELNDEEALVAAFSLATLWILATGYERKALAMCVSLIASRMNLGLEVTGALAWGEHNTDSDVPATIDEIRTLGAQIAQESGAYDDMEVN